jgi:hypothetical protein
MMVRPLHHAAIILSIGVISSCGSPQARPLNEAVAVSKAYPKLDQAIVAGQNLSLINADGQCAVALPDGKVMATKVLPTCKFHRDDKQTIRTKSQSGGTVVLIESSVGLPEKPGDCDTRVQAIMVKGNTVSLSKASNNVAICLPFYWDDAVFLGMGF